MDNAKPGPEDPGDAAFEKYVRRAIAALPEPIATVADDIVVRVVDYADPETLTAMGIRDPFDLLGLYHGISIDQKSVFDIVREPDMIFLYRQPILSYARTMGQDMQSVVRHVVIHEIGHHFGFSDEDMAALERLADESG